MNLLLSSAAMCPQVQLRAALQGSAEALHNVPTSFSEVIALLLLLFGVLKDGDDMSLLLNLRTSWANPTIAGSLSHLRMTVWLPKLSGRSANRFAIQGAAFPLPRTAIARVSPYFASAPTRIGLPHWSSRSSGLFALGNP